MSKEISVGRGKVAIVDDEDFEELSKYKWYTAGNGYAMRRGDRTNGEKSAVMMHRQIADTPEGLVCDHINGHRMDNRKCNLRNCTQMQNGMNKHGAWGKVEYKGVRKLARTRRWSAAVTISGQTIKLGWFKSPEDAAAAYNTVASLLFGEFASLNDGIPIDPEWQAKRIKSTIFKENTWESYLERHPELAAK